jgi:hypothetical protein
LNVIWGIKLEGQIKKGDDGYASVYTCPQLSKDVLRSNFHYCMDLKIVATTVLPQWQFPLKNVPARSNFLEM